VGVLGVLTFQQSRIYRDDETLYRATIERNPDDWMAHQNLGRLLSRIPARRSEEIAHYQAVLRLKPDHARAHYSLGVALFLSDRGREAIDHFDSALRLEPGNPPLVANSHYFLGVILTNTPGRLPDAIGHLEEALRLRPDDPERYNALGEAQVKEGRVAEAKANFEAALRIKPDYATASENLRKVAGAVRQPPSVP
jgi:tetratricopeptide (TPR) repeat protein